MPFIMIYLFAIGGSLGAGWFISKLMNMGFSAAKARKTTMLICACMVIPIFAATQVESLWLAVVLVELAAAAHQGLVSKPADVSVRSVPQHGGDSVVGIGSTFGMIGSVIFSTVIGTVLEASGNYWTLFAISFVACLVT
ncbi:MAG: hypothetical protein ACR5LD_11770 [Symbiopectobacterium sp.]